MVKLCVHPFFVKVSKDFGVFTFWKIWRLD